MKSNWSRRELEALGEPINPELPSRLNRRAGGGGKGGAPPTPDFQALADMQAKSSMDVTRYQTHANRPTINTPFGTQSWEVNRNFDQAGWDAAQQAYKDSYVGPTEGYYTQSGPGGDQGYEEVWVPGKEGHYTMEAPNREDFYGPEQWTMNTTLTPAEQKALESQQAIKQGRSDIALGMLPHAQEAITTPIDYESMQQYGNTPTASEFGRMGDAPQLQTEFDRSGIPEMPTYNQEYVQNIQNQALDYMRPEMQAAQESLDAQLAAQGITPGSEAYDRAQRRLADQQSRDQYNALNTAMSQGNQMYANQLAANSQGFGQNMAAFQFGNNAKAQQQGLNQNALGFNNQIANQEFGQQQQIANYENNLRRMQIAEAQMRQQHPLNNMNALMTGQQVAMPNMPQYNAANRAEAGQYLNAGQMQYGADLNRYNAQQAGMSNFTNGLFQLGSSYMMGGM